MKVQLMYLLAKMEEGNELPLPKNFILTNSVTAIGKVHYTLRLSNCDCLERN